MLDKGVKQVRRDLLTALRQFFEETQRKHPVQHFLSVVEESFRKAGGKVYHHVHIPFLVQAQSGEYDPTRGMVSALPDAFWQRGRVSNPCGRASSGW